MGNLEIGKRIKEAREERGFTKTELASRINVADSTIKRYEDGEIERIKIPIIESIAKALQVNPMWIIGRSEDKYDSNNSYVLDDAYFSFAKEMQEKKISKEDMKKMLQFYEMIKKM
nr:MAG TPA: helix-turn-helix domain protein [Bacteriophage sp.]